MGKERDTALSRRTRRGHLLDTPFYSSGSLMDAVCRLTDVQVTPKATSPPADADGRNQEAERQRKEWREGLKAHIQQQRAGAQQVRGWLAWLLGVLGRLQGSAKQARDRLVWLVGMPGGLQGSAQQQRCTGASRVGE